MQKPSFQRLLIAVFALLIASAPSLRAQSSADSGEPAAPPGRVVLVLPFDNRSGQPNLNWIGDSFPDTINQRLVTAGFLPITRDDREFALDHLGLPPDFRPTRATTLRIAQTLDADYVIVGSFNVKSPESANGPANGPVNLQDTRIMVQAQILEVNKLHLSAPLQDSSQLARLFDIENAIAWKIARQIDPHFNVAEQTFLSASAGIQLTAFESYIRGTDAPTPDERVKRLQAAVEEAPNYPEAELALGKQLYADRDFDQAAAVLAKVPPTDRLSLEAGFYMGLARFNETKYAEAEKAFAFVASRLPLPEVVNDEGVAESRQSQDAQPLFLRASNADPNDPDYHYNLAVSYYKRGDFADANREIDQTLKLRPADTEAAELRTLIAAGRSTSAQKLNGTGFEPTTRLRRTYSEASFRQAAFQLDQVRAARISTLPPARQAAEYSELGEGYIAQGLLPEAEQQFQAALEAYPQSAAAHAGLAEIREQSGSLDQARQEANDSNHITPNAPACVVLARLDIAANNLQSAAVETREALQLAPGNAAAIALRQTLQARGQALP